MKVWQLVVEIPGDIPDKQREELFNIIIDAVYDSDWETINGVDAFMSAHLVDVKE